MCMLCVIPPNVIPAREKLENSALNNPHGFGFAIAVPKEKRIIVERTMSADESINRFISTRAQYLDGYAIWHARYATHGTVTVDNCHPFEVGSTNTYLAHNGVLPVLDDPKDKRSDTRIFAEDLLAQMGGVSALDNRQLWNLLEDFTTGSKVAVLTVDPSAHYEMYILHEEKGWKDGSGVWWSNDTCYLDTYSYNTWSKTSPTDLGVYGDYEEDLVCLVCETPVLEDSFDLGICQTCDHCLSCATPIGACMCYTPPTAKPVTNFPNQYHSAWNAQW